ncbi:hypothetical protein CYMTET_29660 [Cymbomonas tetramitiformis]|uniref:Uncharacterized protein n=1 Tax=Cymbomonas tetramitiformis TaxID=36881 RepID=A0AAE0FKU0_9CHLO|nr:hypothetical protein CYMTET_29660 [Cymbomonas tetramitiformis]
MTSTVAGDVDVDAFADELHTLSLEVGAAACVNQEKTKMIAAPAVALGSTQKMRGFPVKTPEEFDAEAQVPRAPAADEITETAPAPLRLLHQTWSEGQFDPGRKEYQPPVFQGTYQAESDTSSVDTARESTWLDPAQIAELSQKDGQTCWM